MWYERTTCIYCDNPITWLIHGYVDCVEDGRFAINPVCDEHMREFEAWRESETDEQLYGFIYVTDIAKVPARDA